MKKGPWLRIWQFWAACYAALLVYIVFLASRRPSPHLFGVERPRPNFLPLVHKWEHYIHFGGNADLYVEVLGNMVLFIPISLFLFIVAKQRNYALILVIGFGLSLAIETIQYFTGIGHADIDDLILNTLGALLGILVIDGIKRSIQA